MSRELQILSESHLKLSGYLCGKLTPLSLAGQACGMCTSPLKPWDTFSGTAWPAAELSPEVYEGEALNLGF